MVNYSKKKTLISEETQTEALKIARSNQKPGQTKEQTKLIAQGIQKGIDQYKKQYKVKSRELNKQLKKAKHTKQANIESEVEISTVDKSHQNLLPWYLLACSWIVFFVYFISSN